MLDVYWSIGLFSSFSGCPIYVYPSICPVYDLIGFVGSHPTQFLLVRSRVNIPAWPEGITSRNQQRSLFGLLYPLEGSRNRFVDVNEFALCEIRPKLAEEGSVISVIQVA